MPKTVPIDPLDAVMHPDPYPFYDALVRERPLYWDEGLRLWVVSSARNLETILGLSSAHVRPQSESVPRALDGTEAGRLFGQLARMTDGPVHRVARAGAEHATATFRTEQIETFAQICFAQLEYGDLDAFIERFGMYVVASMLGAKPDELEAIFLAARNIARAFAPGASTDAIAHGSASADDLLGFLTPSQVGLLVQTFDATRALIGNTLLGQCRNARVTVEDTVRDDSPVQNTRRFLADDVRIDEHILRRGDTVLLVIAAANRDPLANGRVFTFGSGSHACPGQNIAVSIARTCVQQLRESGLDLQHACSNLTYWPSTNIRAARFGSCP